MKEVREDIISTDLQLYFGRKAQLRRIVDANILDWENKAHRYVSFPSAFVH